MRDRMLVDGVDGSEGGVGALRRALGDVADNGGSAQAVIARQWVKLEAAVAGPQADAERRRTAMTLDNAIKTVLAGFRYPSPVAAEVRGGDPPTVLSQAARGANLLVLGSHGHRRFQQMVRGSVAAECVRRAVVQSWSFR